MNLLINFGEKKFSQQFLYVRFVVHCRNPSSRYFTTLYPQPIALGAGNSFILPITFRPLEKTVYEDQVEFMSTVSHEVFDLFLILHPILLLRPLYLFSKIHIFVINVEYLIRYNI